MKYHKTRQHFFAFECCVAMLVCFGCSGLQKTGSTYSSSAQQYESSPEREMALEHYLSGLIFDQKEEYASAILEYQDALRYGQDPAIHFSLSRDYSALGKHTLAIQHGLETVRSEPDNRIYHENLAEIYVRAFEWEDAIKEYRQIIRIDSNYEQAWSALGRILQLKSPQKAMEVYNAMLAHFGPDWDAYFQLAQLNSAFGKFDKSAEALKGLLALDPANFEVKKTLGDTYLREDSVDAALKVYQELAELRPEHFPTRAALAHAYLVKKDYRRAKEQFDIVLRKDTLTADDQIQFGQVFASFVQRDSQVAPIARDLFLSIQQSHPNDWRPYLFLGVLANVVHDDSSALIYFQKVTQLASWNVDGWVGVATVLFERDQFQRAIQTLEEAKQHVTNEFQIYFLLGISYQRQHQPIDAARELEHAVQFNEKSVEALSALALVYDELKRHEDSDSMYERAIHIDPHYHLVLNNYGYSLAERGIQLERALKMAKDAVDQQPSNQSYLDTIGWIYFRLGQYEEAERFIRKAVELGSKSAVIHEHMGDVYAKLKQKDKALQYWQKALEIDSTNQVLKEKIERGSL